MANIIDITTFNNYTNNFEDSNEVIALKNTILSSAQQVVEDYLGYSPVIKNYEEYFSGYGDSRVYLGARPIVSVSRVVINGLEIQPENIEVRDDCIMDKCRHRIFTNGVDNVYVEYTAGWSINKVPEIIKIAILRIGALMLQEMNGNIGLTGKSSPDNSRTFINYSNYDKYLLPLKGLRIIRYIG